MKNLVKKSLYTTAWTVFAIQWTLNSVFANNSVNPTATFWTSTANITADNLEKDGLENALQRYVNFIMTFLYLIAVFYALWGWFQILTAWWDEEKVKKWKTILIQWAMWLLVIWLAWTIVSWVLRLLNN